ncbi:hypothetical protein [Vibrio sp.]|uniref:hypothetical protein n=1 Tax=Vibrio sp. TaxID=678 RepID=UPI0037A78ACF
MYNVEQFKNTAELKEYAKNRYKLDIHGNLSLENAIASLNEQLNEASQAMENSKTEKPQVEEAPTPIEKPKAKETAAQREQRMMRGQKRKVNISSTSALQIVRQGRKARGQR